MGDEVRTQKPDIVGIAKLYLPDLQPSGRHWKACCPFHQERTASFVVSPQTQTFHCFATGDGGDLPQLISMLEDIPREVALERLAAPEGFVPTMDPAELRPWLRPALAPPARDNQAELARLLVDFNQRYFGGILSGWRIRSHPTLKVLGRCLLRQKLILIARECKTERLAEVVYHEAIHACLGRGGHGYLFHREVERALSVGAPGRPCLRYQPAWLKRLPRCRAWANDNGLPKSYRTYLSRGMYADIACAVADHGMTDMSEAVRDTARRWGLSIARLKAYCSERQARRAFDEGMAAFAAEREAA